MKIFTWLSLIAVIFLLTSPVLALELDVDEDLEDFTTEVRLSNEEMQLLRNPFADYRPQEPESNTQASGQAAPDEEAEEQVEEVVSPPSFYISGSVEGVNGRTVLILEGDGLPIMLQPGQSYNEYQLRSFQNGEAVFVRDNREFNLQVGGGRYEN